jgi:predicted O-linked N-acetylglucosamine transferase (SPINDLY family)
MPPDATALDAEVEAAVGLLRAGRVDEAERALKAVAARAPAQARALHNLGVIALQRGDIETSRELIERSLEHDPDHVGYLGNLIAVHRAAERHEDVVLACRRLLALEPDHVDALIALGNALLALGETKQARARFLWALRLDPGASEAMNGLGAAEARDGRHAQAIGHYRCAVERAPDNPLIHCNLGEAHIRLMRHREAVDAYREALRLSPDMARAASGLGSALTESGRAGEALELLERAVAAEPESGTHWLRLGIARQRLWQHAAALEAYARCLDLDGEGADLLPPILFNLHYMPEVGQETIAEYSRLFGERAMRGVVPCTTHANTPDASRRLRIGYLSGDFREHAVMHFIRPLLRHHDRAAFEIHCLSTCSIADDWTAEARGLADGWHDVWSMADGELFETVQRLGIDVLVDLVGHCQNHRPGVLARRPAPVQVTWLGYFDTTGLPTVDWIVADPILIPPGEEHWYSEKPLRLPRGHLCFDPLMEDIDAPPPSGVDGRITFGCFNNPNKLNPDVVALWARILTRLPDARLLLKGRLLNETEERERLCAAFQARGVAPERLILEDSSPRREYYESYARLDVALDPFPYCGGTTTLQALWMGVPVLTLAGTQGMIRRFGESILSAVGLDEWIARDADEYVEKAVRLASDAAALAELRGDLRRRLLASPVGDGARFTRALEDALRGAWREWCAGTAHGTQ